MYKFNLREWGIIAVLAWMIALESISIDLYLPAFLQISESLKLGNGAVQNSLSFFLAGFAIGQLFWGTLADKQGRKRPAILGFACYTIASLLLANIESVQGLWAFRFLQAFGGAAGVVIARAVVTDIFEDNRITQVFSVLLLIMGGAPVIAPSIGVFLLNYYNWKGIFYAMSVFGLIGIFVMHFFLPETMKKVNEKDVGAVNNPMLEHFLWLIKRNHFILFSVAGSMAYSGLMVYVTNSPFLIMEKGGYSEAVFSLIFALNAGTLMLSSFLVNVLLRHMKEKVIIQFSTITMVLAGCMLIIAIKLGVPAIYSILLSGIYLFALGFLLPTTTAIALISFTPKESGRASALLGFIQLTLTSLISFLTGLLYNGTLFPFAIILFSCGIIALISYYHLTKKLN